jgi:hypothetical protein
MQLGTYVRYGSKAEGGGQCVGVLYDHKPIQLEAGKEFYFEEGELKKRPSFDQTPLEKEAGF